MKFVPPDREVAKSKGWTHQVQWLDQGRQCFTRHMSGATADAAADQLKRQGIDAWVIDLRDALQLH